MTNLFPHRSTLWRRAQRAKDGKFLNGHDPLISKDQLKRKRIWKKNTPQSKSTTRPSGSGYGGGFDTNLLDCHYRTADVSRRLFIQEGLAKVAADLLIAERTAFNEYRAMNKWRWWTVFVFGLVGWGVLAWISL